MASAGRRADTWRLKVLNDHVALARNLLADTGMTVAREDLALEAAFWAQLPGNFALRPRKAPITSRNFAAMVPFHNYPVGREIGNHWGEALALLVTSARSPYYFSLHASDPAIPMAAAARTPDTPSSADRPAPARPFSSAFSSAAAAPGGDADDLRQGSRSGDPGARARGRVSSPLRHGAPTGFNPLQLPEDGGAP